MSKMPAQHIIEAKGNQPLYIRIRDVIFTAIMWLAYFWLMEDFFGFAAVMYDWKVTGAITDGLDKAFDLIHTMEFYLQIVFINSLLLISWALYNQLRFRGKDRRKPPRVIGVQDLAELYNVKIDDVTLWQKTRVLTIHHDGNGTIEKVVPAPRKTP